MFSIIIPLYNKECDILRTLDTVLSQCFTEFEVLIIDDGSTDNSLKVLESVKDPRVKIFSKPNAGVSSARNLGIKSAQYEYIAFLDADDLWESTYLMEVHKAINTFDINHVFATNYTIKLSADRFYFPQFPLISVNTDYEIVEDYFLYSKKDTILTGSSIILHRSAILKIGVFDTQLTHGEDLDYWIRIVAHYNVVFLTKRLMTYRFAASNRSTDKTPELTKAVIHKYNLTGDAHFDCFLSKMASRFAIAYLMVDKKYEAEYCLKKIKGNTFIYWRTRLFSFFPYRVRSYAFKLYMYMSNHYVSGE